MKLTIRSVLLAEEAADAAETAAMAARRSAQLIEHFVGKPYEVARRSDNTVEKLSPHPEMDMRAKLHKLAGLWRGRFAGQEFLG